MQRENVISSSPRSGGGWVAGSGSGLVFLAQMNREEEWIRSTSLHIQMKVQLTPNLIYLWKLNPKWPPDELLQAERWTVTDSSALLLPLSGVAGGLLLQKRPPGSQGGMWVRPGIGMGVGRGI